MARTQLPNKYNKYWVIRAGDWHGYEIGTYHVSGVGCDHQHLKHNEHSGPCLRQTWYEYKHPKPNSDTTKGNFGMGELIHKELQRIRKINVPVSQPEFGLRMFLKRNDNIIEIRGSIDSPEFYPIKDFIGQFGKIQLDVLDYKSASEYTLPYDLDDKNPTHIDQVNIYIGWILTFYLNNNYTKLGNTMIVYVDKHNEATYEMPFTTDLGKCFEKFNEFVNRCWDLHNCLVGNVLPNKEPMKWCKYCKYQGRCAMDAQNDDDLEEELTEEKLTEMYEEKGKKAVWGGEETKGFKRFKKRMKGDM